MKKDSRKSQAEKTPPPAPEPDPPPLRITSLQQLQDLVAAPLECEFILDGRRVSLPCRRLSPAMEATIQAIRREKLPPMKAGERPGERVPDYENREYQEEAMRLSVTARAMAVFHGCPALAEGYTGAERGREAITAYVQGLLTENILEFIHLKIVVGGMEVAERATFTMRPASAPN